MTEFVQKYKYLSVVETDENRIDIQLNGYAEDGWRLVTIIYSNPNDGYLMVFERPIG